MEINRTGLAYNKNTYARLTNAGSQAGINYVNKNHEQIGAIRPARTKSVDAPIEFSSQNTNYSAAETSPVTPAKTQKPEIHVCRQYNQGNYNLSKNAAATPGVMPEGKNSFARLNAAPTWSNVNNANDAVILSRLNNINSNISSNRLRTSQVFTADDGSFLKKSASRDVTNPLWGRVTREKEISHGRTTNRKFTTSDFQYRPRGINYTSGNINSISPLRTASQIAPLKRTGDALGVVSGLMSVGNSGTADIGQAQDFSVSPSVDVSQHIQQLGTKAINGAGNFAGQVFRADIAHSVVKKRTDDYVPNFMQEKEVIKSRTENSKFKSKKSDTQWNGKITSKRSHYTRTESGISVRRTKGIEKQGVFFNRGKAVTRTASKAGAHVSRTRYVGNAGIKSDLKLSKRGAQFKIGTLNDKVSIKIQTNRSGTSNSNLPAGLMRKTAFGGRIELDVKKTVKVNRTKKTKKEILKGAGAIAKKSGKYATVGAIGAGMIGGKILHVGNKGFSIVKRISSKGTLNEKVGEVAKIGASAVATAALRRIFRKQIETIRKVMQKAARAIGRAISALIPLPVKIMLISVAAIMVLCICALGGTNDIVTVDGKLTTQTAASTYTSVIGYSGELQATTTTQDAIYDALINSMQGTYTGYDEQGRETIYTTSGIALMRTSDGMTYCAGYVKDIYNQALESIGSSSTVAGANAYLWAYYAQYTWSENDGSDGLSTTAEAIDVYDDGGNIIDGVIMNGMFIVSSYNKNEDGGQAYGHIGIVWDNFVYETVNGAVQNTYSLSQWIDEYTSPSSTGKYPRDDAEIYWGFPSAILPYIYEEWGIEEGDSLIYSENTVSYAAGGVDGDDLDDDETTDAELSDDVDDEL